MHTTLPQTMPGVFSLLVLLKFPNRIIVGAHRKWRTERISSYASTIAQELGKYEEAAGRGQGKERKAKDSTLWAKTSGEGVARKSPVVTCSTWGTESKKFKLCSRYGGVGGLELAIDHVIR